jgi:hypothetical protein
MRFLQTDYVEDVVLQHLGPCRLEKPVGLVEDADDVPIMSTGEFQRGGLSKRRPKNHDEAFLVGCPVPLEHLEQQQSVKGVLCDQFTALTLRFGHLDVTALVRPNSQVKRTTF